MTDSKLARIALLGALALAPALGVVAAAPAAAQGSESYKFLQAVRTRDNDAFLTALAVPGTNIMDTRDMDTGETPLIIVTRRRDTQYLSFLITKKADPNIRARNGTTALIEAATIGWYEGEQLLIGAGARVDGTNSSGETPLIRAVHKRDGDSVRLLIAAGADPDLKDHVAGKSARDYAAADPRGQQIVKLIAETPKVAPKKISGPQL